MANVIRLAIMMFFTLPAFAATYYVSSSTGADGNPGTQASSFQTIARGSSAMTSGDTLLLKSGDIWTETLTVPCDSCTFSQYGTSTFLPTLTGLKYGVNFNGHNDVIVSYVYVTTTTDAGIVAMSHQDGTTLRGTIDHVIVEHTKWSGIEVINRNSAAAIPLTGWKITNNYVGAVDLPTGLNYNLAGIQLGGLTGALVQGNNVQTVTQMAIQDRPYYAASCSANHFYTNQMSNNEGALTAICPGDDSAFNHMYSGRGFGLQVGVSGIAHDDLIEHLAMGTGGTLYNGIDGNGATGATYTNETVQDVAGCSITIEGTATGSTISGGTYDSTTGGQCALYTTASAGPVHFIQPILWIVAPTMAKPFGYLMTGPGDAAHKYSLANFQLQM